MPTVGNSNLDTFLEAFANLDDSPELSELPLYPTETPVFSFGVEEVTPEKPQDTVTLPAVRMLVTKHLTNLETIMAKKRPAAEKYKSLKKAIKEFVADANASNMKISINIKDEDDPDDNEADE